MICYTIMRQDAAFQPFTANPSAIASPFGTPWNSTAALPASSLDGAINTFLSNNVLTSQITLGSRLIKPASSAKTRFQA